MQTATATQKIQFGKLTKSIIRARKRIGGMNKNVFEALLLYRNDATGLSWASVETLANETDLDSRHVRRSLTELAELGLIEWTGRVTRNGVKVYLVHLEMPEDRTKGSTSIFNGATINHATPPLASHASQTESFNRPKEQQLPNPQILFGQSGLVEQSKNVVVVPSQAETAKAMAAILPAPEVRTFAIQNRAEATQAAPGGPIADKQANTPIARPVAPRTPHVANTPTLAKAQPTAPLPRKPTKMSNAAFGGILKQCAKANLSNAMTVAVVDEVGRQMEIREILNPGGYARSIIAAAVAGTLETPGMVAAAKEAESAAIRATREKAQAEEEAKRTAELAARDAQLEAVRRSASKKEITLLRQRFIAGFTSFQRQTFLMMGEQSNWFRVEFDKFLLNRCLAQA